MRGGRDRQDNSKKVSWGQERDFKDGKDLGIEESLRIWWGGW